MTSSAPASILIVDDTPQNLLLLAQLLKAQGYKVRAAKSGALALQSAQLNPPTLILLDVMMPELDGYATCAQLKANPITQDIPVIFLSALGAAGDKVAAFRAGGVDYITKPFQTEEVLARISTHLRLHEMHQQLQTQNLQLEQEVLERQRTQAQLQLLHELTIIVLGAPTPEAIARNVATRLRQMVGCQRVVVAECRQDGKLHLLAVEATDGFSTYFRMGSATDTPDIAALSRRHYVPDLEAVSSRSPYIEALYAEGTRAYLSIPLPFEHRIIGVLKLEANRPHAFTPEHIEIATQVAVTALSIGIHQARMALNLQDEIAERKQAQMKLQAYAQELEASNAELDAFAHTVAHDLKNPLTVQLGFAQLLAKQSAQWAPKQIEESAQHIVHAAQKMTDITDELLLLASVRRQDAVPREPLNMTAIVSEAYIRLALMFETHTGELHMPEQWPDVIGYAPWVEAVWVNYLSNALKYGGQPPQVTLGWEAIHAPESAEDNEPARRFFRFWVQDNGPGLTPEQQALLFTQFTRLHKTRAKGHGLGLSIVQRIITRLGGEVGVESTVGQGSRFYFTLPANR